MAETIEDLTINYTDDSGKQIVKELDKKVLTKGAWSTIMYKYQDWNRRKDDWSKVKVRLERYRKRGGRYSSQSRFNISSKKQAMDIVEALTDWFGDEED